MLKKSGAEKFNAYLRLTRLDRPIGTLLLLWPTLWALWLSSSGKPDLLVVFVFVLGVVLMRSAGCVINDYADRNIDPHVKRTAARPLATGEIPAGEALVVFAALSLVSFLLVLLMNTLTIKLSLVAVLLAATYPFMKRYTYLPQVHLGAAFGWAVPMSFAAHTGTVPALGWLLFIAVIVWAVAYDTMYAMVDRDDDLRIGVKSTAILFGSADRHWIALFQLTFFVVLVMVGFRAELHYWYYIGLCVAVLLALYHQYLIYGRRRDDCLKAFLGNNWVGAAIFAGIAVNYWSTSTQPG